MTPLEKELLLNLVHRDQKIVENKKTDAVTTQQKSEGWERISLEFNSTPGVSKRNGEQLKKCWNNFKQRARKEKAAKWRYASGTDGGGPNYPPDPFLEKIDSLMPQINLRLASPFDSDGFGAENVSSRESGKLCFLQCSICL